MFKFCLDRGKKKLIAQQLIMLLGQMAIFFSVFLIFFKYWIFICTLYMGVINHEKQSHTLPSKYVLISPLLFVKINQLKSQVTRHQNTYVLFFFFFVSFTIIPEFFFFFLIDLWIGGFWFFFPKSMYQTKCGNWMKKKILNTHYPV